MTSGLEDKIIAFFEGGLSEADSAELLHLTSISPEIRHLFREHEMLRELAHEATRSVMVSPEVESSLFSRIEALAEKPIYEKHVFVFSRRMVIAAVAALIVISGSLGYFVPKLLLSNSSSALTASGLQNILQKSLLPVAASMTALVNSPSKNITHQVVASSFSERTSINSEVCANKEVVKLSNDLNINSSNVNRNVSNVGESAEVALQNIKPTIVREEDIHSDNIGERHSPFDLKEKPPESRSLFEASLQTSSGFTYPADAAPIKPFADQRLSFAYHITENNLIGFRLGSGLYQQLGNLTTQQEGGVEVLKRGIETKRSFSEELYLSQLVPLFFVAPFTLEFAIDGGFIPNGYSLGAEAGIRIPVSETFIFDVAFALSRIHSNALTSQEILASESAGMIPVMLDGVDIHNTLNGRLHYGLLYRF